jgi:hypothetical protein
VVIQIVHLLTTSKRYIHGKLCRAPIKACVKPSNVIDILSQRTIESEVNIMFCIYTTK